MYVYACVCVCIAKRQEKNNVQIIYYDHDGDARMENVIMTTKYHGGINKVREGWVRRKG